MTAASSWRSESRETGNNLRNLQLSTRAPRLFCLRAKRCNQDNEHFCQSTQNTSRRRQSLCSCGELALSVTTHLPPSDHTNLSITFRRGDQEGTSLIFALRLHSLAPLSGAHPPETWTSMRSTTPSSVLTKNLTPTPPRYVPGRAQAELP